MRVITLSKEDAIKMINASPSDKILLTVVDEVSLLHQQNQVISKECGVGYIGNANDIEYQDNDFFGTLSLYGIKPLKDTLIHNISFVTKFKQWE